MAKSITYLETNSNPKATSIQQIGMFGKLVNPATLRFVDKFGVVHTTPEACWEANRA